MIVVIGTVELGRGASGTRPAGLAGAIAIAAADAGARVEVIGKVGDDAAGDELLISLARAGVGHVAVLRDAAHATPVRVTDTTGDAVDDAGSAIDLMLADETSALGTEPDGDRRAPDGSLPSGTMPPSLDAADAQLALRYVADYRVVVAVRPSPDVAAEAIAAAGWAGAHVLLVTAPPSVDPGRTPPPALDPGRTPPGSLVVEVAEDDDGSGGLADRLGRYAAAVDGGMPAADAYGTLVEPIAP